MTIRKRGKSWQVIEMRNGRVFTFTLDHNPSKKEARELLDIKESKSYVVSKTLINAMREYAEIKKPPLLSHSTYANYIRIANQFEKDYKQFADMKIDTLTKADIQRIITKYSERHSPKTVRNMFSLIKVSYSMFLKWDFDITLPKNIKVEPYIPTEEEVKKLFEYAKDTKFYIPLRLATYSLRRSEILGLDISDIGDGEISINKAKVRGLGGTYLKSTKTSASTRVIKVDKELTDLIKKQGYVYKGRVDGMTDFLRKFCIKYNIKHFSLHKLRHFFASEFSYLPLSYIKKMGGWSSTNTLLGIYTHSIKDYSDEVLSTMDKLKGSTMHQNALQ